MDIDENACLRAFVAVAGHRVGEEDCEADKCPASCAGDVRSEHEQRRKVAGAQMNDGDPDAA